MDKQRLVVNGKPRRKIAHAEETGNAGLDGYTIIERQGIDDHKSRYRKSSSTPKNMSCHRYESDWVNMPIFISDD